MEDFILTNIELLYENEDTPVHSIAMDLPLFLILLWHLLILLNLLQGEILMIQDVGTG
jgi:hypothetical protein